MNAKLKIICDGRGTYVELDGKAMGRGVESVCFEHDAPNAPTLNLKINLSEFRFMKDGKLDEVERQIARKEPPEDSFKRLR